MWIVILLLISSCLSRTRLDVQPDENGYFTYSASSKRFSTESFFKNMDYKVKLNERTIHADLDHNIETIDCTPDSLVLKVLEKSVTDFREGDLIAGSNSWGCINSHGIISSFSRQIIQIDWITDHQIHLLTKEIHWTEIFESIDFSMGSKSPHLENSFPPHPEQGTTIPELDSSEEPSTSKRSSSEASKNIRFITPISGQIFRTNDKMSIELVCDNCNPGDSFLIQLKKETDILFLVSIGTVYLDSQKRAKISYTVTDLPSDMYYYLQAVCSFCFCLDCGNDLSSCCGQVMKMRINYLPQLIFLNPLSGNVYIDGDVITVKWEYDETKLSPTADIALRYENEFGFDIALTACKSSISLSRLSYNCTVDFTRDFVSSNRYYFVLSGCYFFWCYEEYSLGFTISKFPLLDTIPVIIEPKPASNNLGSLLTVNWNWENQPAGVMVTLYRTLWGIDVPHSIPLVVSPGTTSVVINLYGLTGSDFFIRMEWECFFVFCRRNVDSQYFSLSLDPKFIFTQPSLDQQYDSEKPITVKWIDQSYLPNAYISLVVQIPILNEFLTHQSQNYVITPSSKSFTLPYPIDGSVFYMYWRISYNCYLPFSSEGFFCQSEYSPRFSIPLKQYFPTWNYDSEKEEVINPIENFYTHPNETIIVDCVNCYIYNEFIAGNISFSLKSGSIASLTADIDGVVKSNMDIRTVLLIGGWEYENTTSLIGEPFPIPSASYSFDILGLDFTIGFLFDVLVHLKINLKATAEMTTGVDFSITYGANLRYGSLYTGKPVVELSINPPVVNYHPITDAVYLTGGGDIEVGILPQLILEITDLFQVTTGPNINLHLDSLFRIPSFPPKSEPLNYFGDCSVKHFIESELYTVPEILFGGKYWVFGEEKELEPVNLALPAISIASGCLLTDDIKATKTYGSTQDSESSLSDTTTDKTLSPLLLGSLITIIIICAVALLVIIIFKWKKQYAYVTLK